MINSNATVYISVKKDHLTPNTVYGLTIETEECITKQTSNTFELKHTLQVGETKVEMLSYKDGFYYESHLGTLKSLSNVISFLNEYNIEYCVIDVVKQEYQTCVHITVDRDELEQKVDLYNQYVHDKIKLDKDSIQFGKNKFIVFAKYKDEDSVVHINSYEISASEVMQLFNTIGIDKYNVTVSNTEFPF